jgi:hypothetical protein
MTKAESIQKLNEAFAAIEALIHSLPEEQFFQKPENGKWSVAENVEHLFLSVKPLVGLFGKKDIMLANWGKSDRTSGTYDELVNTYLERLSKLPSGVAFGPVAPVTITGSRDEITGNLRSIHGKFIERTEAMTEEELDSYQVPHPLLGLLTCREFVYFTAYHTQHHHKAILNIIS